MDSNLIVKVGADIADFQEKMRAVSQDLKKTVGDAENSLRGFDRLGSNLTSFGSTLSIAVTAPLVALGAGAIKVASDMQVAEKSFTTLLGSAQAAGSFLSQLKEFAASTPFQFPELVDAAKRMLALGFAAKDIVPDLRIIGDQVAALGGGAELLNRVTLALGQMGAKGKVSAEEMRQLAEAGIPAWKYLADAIGKSIPEAMKLAQQGAISASTAIPAILQGMAAKTGGQMKGLSETITGQWSNIRDQITFALADIGKQLEPFAQDVLNVMKGGLEIVKSLTEAFGKLPQPVREGVIAAAALAAAIGPVIFVAGQMISAISTVGSTIFSVAGIAAKAASGELPALTGALTSLGSVVAVAATAFGAFKLGEWLYSNVPALKAFGDGLADLILKIPGVEQGIGKLATLGVNLVPAQTTQSIKNATDALTAMGVTVEAQGSRTLPEYLKYLSALKEEHGLYAGVVKKSTDAHVDFDTQLKAVKQSISDLEALEKAGFAVQDQLTAKRKEEMQILQQMHPGLKTIFNDISDQLSLGYDYTQMVSAQIAEAQKQITANGAVASSFEKLGIPFSELIADAATYKTEMAKVVAASASLPQGVDNQTAAFNRLSSELNRGTFSGLKDVHSAQTEVFDYMNRAIPTVEQMNARIGVMSEALRQWKTDSTAGGQSFTNAFASVQLELAKAAQAERDYIQDSLGRWSNLYTGINQTVKGTFDSMVSTLITGKGSFKDEVVGMLQGIATAVVDSFVKPFENAIARLISGAITDLLSGKGLGGILGSLKDIGSSITGIFGSGASAAGGAAGAAGQAAGAAGSAGSSAAGAAASGITGIIGAIGSVVSAISGIIGNFQMAGMNKTLDLIEHSTRYSQIFLNTLVDKANETWPVALEIKDAIWNGVNPLLNELRIEAWKQTPSLVGMYNIVNTNLNCRLSEIRDAITASRQQTQSFRGDVYLDSRELSNSHVEFLMTNGVRA